ncbi:MAG: deoxyribodipyrimidine photo-lyase [Hyphomicrobiales bacterium]
MDNEVSNIFWFRRDLRWDDNHALYKSLCEKGNTIPIFIFDPDILEHFDNNDHRVFFLYNKVLQLKKEAEELGSSLWIFYDKPELVFNHLFSDLKIKNVFCNEDYEPEARKRDDKISDICKNFGIKFHAETDQVIFHPNKVLKQDNSPFVVFTPFSKAWLKEFDSYPCPSYPSHENLDRLAKVESKDIPELDILDLSQSYIKGPKYNLSSDLITKYDDNRDIPSSDGVSRIGFALRFGTISIRYVVRKAKQHNSAFLRQLIWREFYTSILYHFPHVEKSCFRSKYDHIEWENNEEYFDKWKNGLTGFPFVDAGMRELNKTGYMHNRVRMLTASFLVKNLLIDWKWGETYFAKKLFDFDLACNNGNWQWVAGCGVDAAPYFRIFNPTLQTKRFDPHLLYIKKWVPEFASDKYPKPMINIKESRDKCLNLYKSLL